MKRCPYCRKFAWPWQGLYFNLHKLCLEIYCQGYARGIIVASEQAGKIIIEMQQRMIAVDKSATMQ